MKRAENYVDAKISPIRFENDCLIFEFAKSKGHQKAKDHVGSCHVYTNPHDPFMCPVLALARYIFTYPDVLCGRSPLFEGKNQYSTYSEIFSKLVKENMPELSKIGARIGDLGTHSLRKESRQWCQLGTQCPHPL